MNQLIYLNCAATSLRRPPCVAEAVVRAMSSGGNAARGTSVGEMSSARGEYACREALAGLLGFGHPDRLVFAANATQALNTAIMGVARPGDVLVGTDWDHNSILRPLHECRDFRGCEVRFVTAGRDGQLDLSRLDDLLDGARLLCLTHASNLTGDRLTFGQVRDAVACAHDHGALVLLDCSQTAGCVPVPMDAMGVDLLAVTGHKALMGPTGTGALLVAPGVDVHPLLSGGTGVLSFEEHQPAAFPEHLEAGTLNAHGIAGLLASVEWIAKKRVDTIQAHDDVLRHRLVEGLQAIPGVTVYGREDAPHSPAVAMNLAGWESSELADALAQDYGIATRAGAHCAPRMHCALGTQDLGAVRLSFGWFNTQEEIDLAVEAVAELAAEDAAEDEGAAAGGAAAGGAAAGGAAAGAAREAGA